MPIINPDRLVDYFVVVGLDDGGYPTIVDRFPPEDREDSALPKALPIFCMPLAAAPAPTGGRWRGAAPRAAAARVRRHHLARPGAHVLCSSGSPGRRARAQKLGAGGRRGERCAAAARARWRLPPSQRAFLARCCDVWSQPPRAVMRRARDSFLVYVRKTFVVVMVEQV